MLEHLLSTFGYPMKIFTDQGVNFQSKLFKAFCDLLQIHPAWTTPYRPSGNGKVVAIRCYVDKSPRTWDQHLSAIAGALRSCVNRATGFTPNQLMLGREVFQPLYLMIPLQKDGGNTRTKLEYFLGLQGAKVI